MVQKIFYYGALAIVALAILAIFNYASSQEIKLDYEEISARELNCIAISNEEKGIIIKTYGDYLNLISVSESKIGCDNLSRNPPVDFTKKILLGKLVKHGACEVVEKSVVVEDKNRRIVYRINVFPKLEHRLELQECPLILKLSPKWIAIEKPPEDFNIIFEIKSEK